jgi:hypothetical protein
MLALLEEIINNNTVFIEYVLMTAACPVHGWDKKVAVFAGNLRSCLR